MRDITRCYPQLREAWRYTQSEWARVNPNKPQPIITCTLRTLEEQAALHAQGRLPLAEINKLRKKAGLAPINEAQSKLKITNAKPGQSKHNPDSTGLSRAFDIAFVNLSSGKNATLNWDTKLFTEFYKILSAKYPTVSWGGNWKSFKDFPHFEVV